MLRKRILTAFFALAALGGSTFLTAQNKSQARPRVASSTADRPCTLTGAYRIDVQNSDALYTAVRGATGNVPFQDQQQFFMDLSVRLTPPDLLAIECTGKRVSVGSSRSAKVTFLADGKLRQERFTDGTIVNSRITTTGDTLTFISTGKADDNLNVVFRSVDGGRKLRVTRRIYAEQLPQPIVIQSLYERLSDRVDWDVYNGRLVADRTRDDSEDQRPTSAVRRAPISTTRADTPEDLKRALEDWISATNQRDIDRQMAFYMPQMKAFYLTRNTTRDAVRSEKDRAFSTARSIDISADEPEIVLQDNGRTAVMRFRKSYRIVGPARTRSGVVIQELRWQRTSNGWRIFSERDVRVIR